LPMSDVNLLLEGDILKLVIWLVVSDWIAGCWTRLTSNLT